MTRKNVGISLLVWAAGMGAIFLLNRHLNLPESFTVAHVFGAACVGSLVDYLLFCRRPSREVNVCERCSRSLTGMKLLKETVVPTKEGA